MSPYNKLWTKTAFEKVPAYGSTSEQADPIAHVKLFCKLNGWRWFITEYDKKTGRAFGLVQGFSTEAGDFIINEVNPGDWEGEDMQSQNNNFRGRYPMPPFERDSSFKPTPLSVIRAKLEATGHA
jgi:hypothetical protein